MPTLLSVPSLASVANRSSYTQHAALFSSSCVSFALHSTRPSCQGHRTTVSSPKRSSRQPFPPPTLCVYCTIWYVLFHSNLTKTIQRYNIRCAIAHSYSTSSSPPYIVALRPATPRVELLWPVSMKLNSGSSEEMLQL